MKSSLVFIQTHDMKALASKFVLVNRAPVMMAWATVVAERLHFKRDEALSIGSFSFIVHNTPRSRVSHL